MIKSRIEAGDKHVVNLALIPHATNPAVEINLDQTSDNGVMLIDLSSVLDVDYRRAAPCSSKACSTLVKNKETLMSMILLLRLSSSENSCLTSRFLPRVVPTH